jgi:hypothetical protein
MNGNAGMADYSTKTCFRLSREEVRPDGGKERG